MSGARQKLLAALTQSKTTRAAARIPHMLTRAAGPSIDRHPTSRTLARTPYRPIHPLGSTTALSSSLPHALTPSVRTSRGGKKVAMHFPITHSALFAGTSQPSPSKSSASAPHLQIEMKDHDQMMRDVLTAPPPSQPTLLSIEELFEVASTPNASDSKNPLDSTEMQKQFRASLRRIDINQSDDTGYTLLMRAAEAGNNGAVRMLLKAGADIDHRADDGETVSSIITRKLAELDSTAPSIHDYRDINTMLNEQRALNVTKEHLHIIVDEFVKEFSSDALVLQALEIVFPQKIQHSSSDALKQSLYDAIMENYGTTDDPFKSFLVALGNAFFFHVESTRHKALGPAKLLAYSKLYFSSQEPAVTSRAPSVMTSAGATRVVAEAAETKEQKRSYSSSASADAEQRTLKEICDDITAFYRQQNALRVGQRFEHEEKLFTELFECISERLEQQEELNIPDKFIQKIFEQLTLRINRAQTNLTSLQKNRTAAKLTAPIEAQLSQLRSLYENFTAAMEKRPPQPPKAPAPKPSFLQQAAASAALWLLPDLSPHIGPIEESAPTPDPFAEYRDNPNMFQQHDLEELDDILYEHYGSDEPLNIPACIQAITDFYEHTPIDGKSLSLPKLDKKIAQEIANKWNEGLASAPKDLPLSAQLKIMRSHSYRSQFMHEQGLKIAALGNGTARISNGSTPPRARAFSTMMPSTLEPAEVSDISLLPPKTLAEISAADIAALCKKIMSNAPIVITPEEFKAKNYEEAWNRTIADKESAARAIEASIMRGGFDENELDKYAELRTNIHTFKECLQRCKKMLGLQPSALQTAAQNLVVRAVSALEHGRNDVNETFVPLDHKRRAYSTSSAPQEEHHPMIVNWAEKVSNHDVKGVLSCYDTKARLIPTLSPKILYTQEQREAYFNNLVQRENLRVRIKESSADKIGNNLVVITGNYEFIYTQNGSPHTIDAFFTFVGKHTEQGWQILSHHSSQVPHIQIIVQPTKSPQLTSTWKDSINLLALQLSHPEDDPDFALLKIGQECAEKKLDIKAKDSNGETLPFALARLLPEKPLAIELIEALGKKEGVSLSDKNNQEKTLYDVTKETYDAELQAHPETADSTRETISNHLSRISNLGGGQPSLLPPPPPASDRLARTAEKFVELFATGAAIGTDGNFPCAQNER